MTKDEIIQQLIELNIVLKIGEDYLLTEKYKTIEEAPAPKPPASTTINYDKIMNHKTAGEGWPEQIASTSGRTRAEALVLALEIPKYSPDGKYRLRSLDPTSINIINNAIADRNIIPSAFMKALTNYYQVEQYPSAFKNLVISGEFLTIYREWINGEADTKIDTGSW